MLHLLSDLSFGLIISGQKGLVEQVQFLLTPFRPNIKSADKVDGLLFLVHSISVNVHGKHTEIDRPLCLLYVLIQGVHHFQADISGPCLHRKPLFIRCWLCLQEGIPDIVPVQRIALRKVVSQSAVLVQAWNQVQTSVFSLNSDEPRPLLHELGNFFVGALKQDLLELLIFVREERKSAHVLIKSEEVGLVDVLHRHVVVLLDLGV